MTANRHQSSSTVNGRPAWRTPSLTEDAITDITMNQTNSPGDDGLDQFVGYTSTGLS